MTKPTLYITRGLPASGKSTWAKKFVEDENAKGRTVKRVNRDDLRAMIHGNNLPFNRNREKFVVQMRNNVLEHALADGFSVICDDTNLGNIEWAYEMARKADAFCEVKDFTDVDVDECIRRDKKRANYVGADVIKRFYRQHLQPKIEKPLYFPDKEDALICDLDGTVALLNGRDPYNAATCEQDLPNIPIIRIVKAMQKEDGLKLVFCSGRHDTHRNETERWLLSQGFKDFVLLMRKEGDTRKDALIKEELLDNDILPYYNIRFILDDRNQVVELWRRRGFTCLQVADGDF